jgi:NSS family neurotransmitter:Na+ symporter
MAKKIKSNEIQREQWSSKMTFVLASAGSAIGLGNIWMFPWRMGTYGGSAFLFIYLLIVVCIGIVGLMGEFALGRGQQKGPISALDAIFREKRLSGGKWFGFFPVLMTFAVTVFYMIVVGWIIHYFVIAFRGFEGVDLAAYFGAFAGTPYALIWHIIAVIITGLITYLGIKKGLEPVNKFLMPALFVIMIVLVIRAVTLPGAIEGINFMFAPNFAALADPFTWFNALAQALFSLSLLGCTLVIYGSYLPKDTDIPKAAGYTALFDTGAAILAAFIVFPAAFAFGVNVNSGIPLLFITLPGLFGQMPAGTLFGALFFLLIIFAAITSAISLFESAIEPIMDAFKWDRKKATIITSLAALIIGIPLTVNMAWFTQWMRLTSAVLMPIGTLIVMIAFFWVYGSSRAKDEVNKGASTPVGSWFEFFGKYVAVFGTLFILIGGILRFAGIWK